MVIGGQPTIALDPGVVVGVLFVAACVQEYSSSAPTGLNPDMCRRLYVSEIWMPAAAPLPPTTWKVFPEPTLTGCALNGPQNPRCAALPVRSNDTTAVGEPFDTNDWVVSGTPTADPDDDAVDWPSDDQP